MSVITIGNDGQELAETNYFESEYARSGKVYMSINAGAFRLLFPDSMLNMLEDMSSAKEVVISLGKWPDAGKHLAFEILFEDFSDNPFCLHIGSEMIDRIPNDMHRKDETIFTIWTSKGKVLTLPCYTRKVNKIPYLKPRKKP